MKSNLIDALLEKKNDNNTYFDGWYIRYEIGVELFFVHSFAHIKK